MNQGEESSEGENDQALPPAVVADILSLTGRGFYGTAREAQEFTDIVREGPDTLLYLKGFYG